MSARAPCGWQPGSQSRRGSSRADRGWSPPIRVGATGLAPVLAFGDPAHQVAFNQMQQKHTNAGGAVVPRFASFRWLCADRGRIDASAPFFPRRRVQNSYWLPESTGPRSGTGQQREVPRGEFHLGDAAQSRATAGCLGRIALPAPSPDQAGRLPHAIASAVEFVE